MLNGSIFLKILSSTSSSISIKASFNLSLTPNRRVSGKSSFASKLGLKVHVLFQGAPRLGSVSKQPDDQNAKKLFVNRKRHRIINYAYYPAEGICSSGSEAVESALKQIDRRVQISGAQWKVKKVPQVLAHRAAYLNGLLSLKG